MGPLGWPEIGVILLVVLLLFGAKKIPEIARGLGQGIREFRRATTEVVREFEHMDEPASKANTANSTSDTKPHSEAPVG